MTITCSKGHVTDVTDAEAAWIAASGGRLLCRQCLVDDRSKRLKTALKAADKGTTSEAQARRAIGEVMP